MPSPGRPKIDNPKKLKIGFRVSEEEREKLDVYCEKKKLTQSQVLSEALELLYKKKP
ncbi:MAG: hypothetical protein GX567_03525 [Clostridia bacterium]|nr:hypothetical protein [Clostridia bacterium]